jgi:hypothetical protein
MVRLSEKETVVGVGSEREEVYLSKTRNYLEIKSKRGVEVLVPHVRGVFRLSVFRERET